MKTDVVFYVSGHGYGHLVRMGEIIRELERLGHRTVVRKLGAPVAESPDSLVIHGAQTLVHWHGELVRHPEIVEVEAAFVRSSGARLMVADIPFLAGAIAEASGVPVIGISNFTWNWILGPLVKGSAEGVEVLRSIEAGYRRFMALWQLPFGQPDGLDAFPEVVSTPLIATRGVLTRDEVRARLRVGEGQPMVFVAFRGPIPLAAFQAAALSMPGMIFVTPEAEQAASAVNARHWDRDANLTFQDVADASDAVISKLGFGLVAGCVANKIRLLHVPRLGFREDEVTREQAPRFTAVRELAAARFAAGEWRTDLEELLATPMPVEQIAADGARVCAARIVERIR